MNTHTYTVLDDNRKEGWVSVPAPLFVDLLSLGKHLVQLRLLPQWEFMGPTQEDVHGICVSGLCGLQIIAMVIPACNDCFFKDFSVCVFAPSHRVTGTD